MKNAKQTVISFLILLTIWGCCEYQEPVCELTDGVGPNIKISKNELILKFPEDSQKLNSNEFKVIQENAMNQLGLKPKDVEIDYCSCGDRTLQKWTYNHKLAIETSVNGMKDKDGGNQVEGDVQFTITLPTEGGALAVDPYKEFDRESLTHLLGNSGIGIAVLDTGIDLDFIGREKLFRNPTELSCGEGLSGWNFVNGTSDIQDDHTGIGHGTLVTKTISTPLDAAGIEYRIAPIKIFDKQGSGSYWDIVCAMSFVKEINEKSNGAIKVINASFGGSLGEIPEKHVSILKNLIEEMRDQAIVVTSAGNCHFNTDSNEFKHYPSGYSLNNVMAIGGFHRIGRRTLIHEESNYGPEIIDASTAFNRNLTVIDNAGTQYPTSLSGTSYSAAWASSLLSQYYSGLLNFTNLDASVVMRDFLSNPTGKSADLDCFIEDCKYYD